MRTIIEYRDLGLLDYKEAWEYQETLFKERVEGKLHSRTHPAEEERIFKDFL